MGQIDFEKARGYFVNPEDRLSAERLAGLGSQAIRVMADIYASGGDWDKMQPKNIDWLKNGSEAEEVKKVLTELLEREMGTRRFDNKFMGQIHPQGSEIGILANLVAAYMNTNTVVKEVSDAENEMEKEAIAWLADIFGYDQKECSGNIVTGGTTANLASLWMARERKLADLRSRGKRERGQVMYVLGTEMAHYSVTKACDILGENVVFLRLPTKGFKTDVERLNEIVEKMTRKDKEIMAIVGLGGETETGLVDD